MADLPLPDSPTRPSTWPGRIWNEIFLTAGWVPKAMERFETSSSGADFIGFMVANLWTSCGEMRGKDGLRFALKRTLNEGSASKLVTSL